METTYSEGGYFFSVVKLVFITLDILASCVQQWTNIAKGSKLGGLLWYPSVAVLPNILHSYAVMCSCCSRILCIQPTNSITLKGSVRDKVPSPLPLQTLSVEIITEPFNAVWWAVSRSEALQTAQASARQRRGTFRTVTLKYCIQDNCLMESSKIENLINVWRRFDQAALKDIVFFNSL